MQVYFETLGCAMNHADTAIMRNIAVENGHTLVETAFQAEVIILNTCTVRGATERAVLRRLRELQTEPKTATKKLVVAGCLAAAQPELVKKVAPEASLLGPKTIDKLPSVLRTHSPVCLTHTDTPRSAHPGSFQGVVAIVPIAQGCKNECSYCIVKKARGDLHSFPIDVIKAHVQSAVDQGAREIDITAQDTGCYGWDIGATLPELLSHLVEIRGSFRIRVGMMNPDSTLQILPKLLDVFKSPKIYKFLHVPVQSGNDEILSKMTRRYTVADFRSIVHQFREVFPDISIATDIIVGFPGETDAAFQQSKTLLEEVHPDKVHVARYSPRPYTASFNLPQIASDTKKNRSALLAKTRLALGKTKNQLWVGRNAEALITSFSPKNQLEGRLDNYKPVILIKPTETDTRLIGKRVQVDIVGAGSVSLLGRIHQN